MVEWFGFVYAALVAAGGLVGYLKAGSIPSLAAGLVGGGIAAFGAATQNYFVLLGKLLIMMEVLIGVYRIECGSWWSDGLQSY